MHRKCSKKQISYQIIATTLYFTRKAKIMITGKWYRQTINETLTGMYSRYCKNGTQWN